MANPFSLEAMLETVIANGLGYAVGTASGAALTPFVQPLANEAWLVNPALPLDPQVAAQLALKRPQHAGAMQHEAALTGVSSDRFEILLGALALPLATGELTELYRRGKIDAEAVRRGLSQAMVDPSWHEAYLELVRVLLSPADAAMARQQGFIDAGDHIRRSALQGVDAGDAELLFELSGEPYGPEAAIELWRRGHIDEARVRQVVREGRIKTKYEPDILAMRYVPLSAAVAAEALVRERMPESRAVQIAEQNGIQRDDFLFWSDMLGRPIAPGQALQLARRGEFSRARFQEVVARSDVRTEYADDLWRLRRAIPSLFQLRNLVANGSISDALAIEYASDLGYDHDLAVGIVQAAHRTKTSKTRDLSVSAVVELYEAGLETQAWALERLQELGYDAAEAQWELDLAEARLLISYLRSALTRIRGAYVTHKSTEDETLARLEQLGVSADRRAHYVDVWSVEREGNVVRLTNAEIGQALKYSIFSTDEAIARWQEHGYSLADATIKAEIVGKGPQHPPALAVEPAPAG